MTPSSLIAELAAARRTIAPAPQPKLKAKGGLIAVVVLIVLGLAGAGGWMFVNDIGPAALLAPKAAVSSTAAPAQSKPPVASPAQR